MNLTDLMHRFPDLAPDLARAYLGGPPPAQQRADRDAVSHSDIDAEWNDPDAHEALHRDEMIDVHPQRQVAYRAEVELADDTRSEIARADQEEWT